MKSKTILLILVCAIAVLLIYAMDWFRLMYLSTPWDQLGETPITPAQVIFFNADTPNVIGYVEQETGENITCAQAVAYVETAAGEMYRCCNTAEKISCMAGDFSPDIPPRDPVCTDGLRLAFGLPASLPDVKDYEAYGNCSEDGNPKLTVVQLDANGRILWKTLNGWEPQVLTGILRCILGPALVLIAARALYVARKRPDPDRQIRRW